MSSGTVSSLNNLLDQLRNSSAYRRREREGAQPEHTWLSILNSFRDPVALFDHQLRHVYVNEATALATNIPSERFRGKRMRDLGHPEHICDQINLNIETVFKTGEERTAIVHFDGPDGAMTYESRMLPEFAEDGETVEYVIVVSRGNNLERQRR